MFPARLESGRFGWVSGCLCLGAVIVEQFLLQVRIDFLNRQWTSSLVLGVITCPPERLNFPASACALKRAAWLLRGRGIFHNGLKVSGEPERPRLLSREGWRKGSRGIWTPGRRRIGLKGADGQGCVSLSGLCLPLPLECLPLLVL